MPPEPKRPKRGLADPSQSDPDLLDPKGHGSFTLCVPDWSGQERRGEVVVAWQKHPKELEPLGADESFRILILGEPLEEVSLTADRLAACVPARPLTWRPSVREAALSYTTLAGQRPSEEDSPFLPRRDVQSLSAGRIHSPLDLGIGPELVFTPDGYVHLELLAQEILLRAALKPYIAAIDTALAAPAAPSVAGLDIQQELRQLARRAGQILAQGGQAAELPEMEQTLQRLAMLAEAEDSQDFLARANQNYLQPGGCAEDTYLARALTERVEEAVQLVQMRRFVAQATVPGPYPDLALDRTILENQLSFAELVAEPHRFAGTVSSFAHFRNRFRPLYIERHDRYWQEAVAVHGRLISIGPRVDALRKLNTLTELGPPVGEGAIVAFAALSDETAGCQLSGRLEEELGENAVCPSCGFSLEHDPLQNRAKDVIDRVDRACQRQLTRLSSKGVQQVLARSGDPRVEQFLKVVQASQLSSLADLLDDALLGFLRRFLVEARIQTVLQPIISRLESGLPPQEEEAEQVMKEVSRVLQRAFRAARHSLPAPEAHPPLAETSPGDTDTPSA
ncbi:MAG: hypothetical protein ACE5KW_00425 [Dehalococcoidia bacterium]